MKSPSNDDWMTEATRMSVEGAKAACADVLAAGCDAVTGMSLARTLRAEAFRIEQDARKALERR